MWWLERGFSSAHRPVVGKYFQKCQCQCIPYPGQQVWLTQTLCQSAPSGSLAAPRSATPPARQQWGLRCGAPRVCANSTCMVRNLSLRLSFQEGTPFWEHQGKPPIWAGSLPKNRRTQLDTCQIIHGTSLKPSGSAWRSHESHLTSDPITHRLKTEKLIRQHNNGLRNTRKGS